MLKKLHLKLALLLTAMVMGAGPVWADSETDSETITFSELNLENGVQYSEAFGTNISVTFAGGGNDGKYYTTGTGIRTYGGGNITVTAKGKTITAISTTFSGESYAPADASVWSCTGGTGTGTAGISASWSGSATKVVMTRPSGSGNWRLQAITVTYETSGGGGGEDNPPSEEVESASVTLDFTDNSDWSFPEGSSNGATNAADFTDGNGYKITLAAPTKYYFNTDGYLMLGKNGATLTLPAFPFNVKKIEVVGRSGASPAVLMNIYVGEDAVSEETTGAAGTNTYAIADNRQAAGTVYTLKVNSSHNTQITAIKIYGYENVAVSADGYATNCSAYFATYCSAYALNFKGVEGLTAYQAVMEGTTVKFTTVNDVPANTGVLVKGTAAATYEVPVVASSNTDVDDNVLVGVTAVTKIGKTTDDNSNIVKYNYVLKNGSDGVGFYQVNNDKYRVRANSAYLAIPYNAASPGAKLFIGLDGETAVEAVAAEELPTGTAYNLQGQRVGNDYKGVVIVNGKKVIR